MVRASPIRRHKYWQVDRLSQRTLTARCVSFGQKWKTETADNILRPLYVYLQPLWRNWPANLWNSVKKTQNKGYNAIQGHSIPIEDGINRKPICDFLLWLILTDILSRTLSELSQIIVQILDTAFLSHPLGEVRSNIRCSSLNIANMVNDYQAQPTYRVIQRRPYCSQTINS